MVKAIVIHNPVAWYCKRCKKGHQVLYKEGEESFCPKCVPKEVKDQAKYFNHINEPIDYKEEE